MPYLFLFLVAFFFHSPTIANETLARQSLQDFLAQSLKDSDMPIEIKIGAFNLSQQAPCTTYVGFLPANTRLVGKTWVGLRCLSPQHWELILPVHIAFLGRYVIARHHLRARQILTADDLTYQTGDLTSLPFGAFTQVEKLEGLMLTQSLRAGQMVLEASVKKPYIIQKGQRVRLIYSGQNFAITSEGIAENDASLHDSVRVKTPSGQKITGTANENGEVFVQPDFSKK